MYTCDYASRFLFSLVIRFFLFVPIVAHTVAFFSFLRFLSLPPPLPCLTMHVCAPLWILQTKQHPPNMNDTKHVPRRA